MKSFRIIVFMLGMTILAGCATTQDIVILDDRISDLEKDRIEAERTQRQVNALITDINKLSNQKSQKVLGQYAGIRAEIAQVREQVRALNGRFEEIDFTLKNLQDAIQSMQGNLERLDKTATQNTNRIIKLEQYLGLESSSSGDATTHTAASVSQENEMYNSAKALFDKKKYGPARLTFQKFIKKYPKSKSADNAQFWIGETYYQEKWYEKAILEYDEVKRRYPKGNKVQAALLKQGLAFKNLGEKSNAKVILEELIQKYPRSKEAEIAKKELKGL